MSPRLRIAPSLLSADFADLAGAIRAAEAGGADAFHLDVMDGHFVPNISFGPGLVRAVAARTKRPLDIHLMVEKPQDFLSEFAKAGGSTLVFHLEANADAAQVIAQAHDLGVGVGAAIKPETPFSALRPWVDRVDQLLVMSVHPGFSGQTFLPEALPKLREARAALDAAGSNADLSIDGGVTESTAASAAGAGATFFVCGNAVFASGDVATNLARIRASITRGAIHEVR